MCEVQSACMQLEHVPGSGLHTQLFSHPVSVLHAVIESLSLSTAHGAQCDLQFHRSASRGGRELDTVQPHLTLAVSGSELVSVHGVH